MDVVVGGLQDISPGVQVALARWLVAGVEADDILMGKLEPDGCTIFIAILAGVLQDSPGLLVTTAIELADTRKPSIFVFTMN